MTKKVKRICYVVSPYSFLIYLLKFGYNEEDIYIFDEAFPNYIAKNVNHILLPYLCFIDGPLMAPLNSLKGIYKNIVGYVKYFYHYTKLRLLLFNKTRGYDLEVYGHAHVPFSFMFYENEKSYIIEDGMLNYTKEILEPHKINPILDKILHFFGMYIISAKEGLGTHKNIKKLYFTKENTNPLIKDKVEILNLQELWDNKTEEEKEKILDIYNFNRELKDIGDDCVLFLTDPLSEDEFMDYEEEIEIYRKILNNFKNENVIIKPHPREEKDISKIFPEIITIDKGFPIELLKLMGFKPKAITSVVSTALLNYADSSKVFLYDNKTSSDRINAGINTLKKMIKDYEVIK